MSNIYFGGAQTNVHKQVPELNAIAMKITKISKIAIKVAKTTCTPTATAAAKVIAT